MLSSINVFKTLYASSLFSSAIFLKSISILSASEAKIILLKTKKDLEQKSGEDLVTDEEISELAKEVNAFKVFKCSISTGEGISDAFDAAVMDILKKEKVNKKPWYQCLCC